MTSELKPCPFCGGVAEAGKTCSEEIIYVFCTECEVEVQDVHAWNTRAVPSESMGLGGSCEATELLNDLRFRLENMPPDSATDDALINRIIRHVAQLSATPVSDSMKAENERLRCALTKIASFTQSTELLWWQVEARSALNMEDSNDDA